VAGSQRLVEECNDERLNDIDDLLEDQRRYVMALYIGTLRTRLLSLESKLLFIRHIDIKFAA